MAFASPWEDQQQTQARIGRVGGANPNGPPGVNAAPQGAPAAPTTPSPWQGYQPGYLGKTGGPKAGSGWGYYYADTGQGNPNAGAGLAAAAQNFNYNETPQSSLAKAGMGRAEGLISSGDPDALASKFYRKGENVALRAGQASREQQLAENADTYAQRGMLNSGGLAASQADIRRQASQARLSALDQLGSQAMQFGEQAAIGRLGAGMPWENSDLGRRETNTEWQNRGIDKRADMAAQAASASAAGRAAGQERILEIPGFGEVPESMLPYIGQFMGGL
jgi:hypothetical protein